MNAWLCDHPSCVAERNSLNNFRISFDEDVHCTNTECHGVKNKDQLKKCVGCPRLSCLDCVNSAKSGLYFWECDLATLPKGVADHGFLCFQCFPSIKRRTTWPCNDPGCVADYERLHYHNLDDHVHCSNLNCHGVKWVGNVVMCVYCKHWSCNDCANSGKTGLYYNQSDLSSFIDGFSEDDFLCFQCFPLIKKLT